MVHSGLLLPLFSQLLFLGVYMSIFKQKMQLLCPHLTLVEVRLTLVLFCSDNGNTLYKLFSILVTVSTVLLFLYWCLLPAILSSAVYFRHRKLAPGIEVVQDEPELNFGSLFTELLAIYGYSMISFVPAAVCTYQLSPNSIILNCFINSHFPSFRCCFVFQLVISSILLSELLVLFLSLFCVRQRGLLLNNDERR